MSPLGELSIPIETVMLLSFYIVLGIYAIFSAILYYHWQTYATDAKVSGLTLTLFFILTVPFLVVMGIMLLII